MICHIKKLIEWKRWLLDEPLKLQMFWHFEAPSIICISNCVLLWLDSAKGVFSSFVRPQESIQSTFYEQLLIDIEDPKSPKKTDNLNAFFGDLGSVRVKAAGRMLMKLTPGCTRNIPFYDDKFEIPSFHVAGLKVN